MVCAFKHPICEILVIGLNKLIENLDALAGWLASVQFSVQPQAWNSELLQIRDWIEKGGFSLSQSPRDLLQREIPVDPFPERIIPRQPTEVALFTEGDGRTRKDDDEGNVPRLRCRCGNDPTSLACTQQT